MLLVTDCGAAGARGQRGPGHGERPEAAPRPPRRGPPLLLPAGAGRGAPARAGGAQQAAEGAAGGRRVQHRAAHLLAPGAAQGALHPLPLPAPRPGLPAHAASIPGDQPPDTQSSSRAGPRDSLFSYQWSFQSLLV